MGTVARPRKPRRLSAFPYTIDLIYEEEKEAESHQEKEKDVPPGGNPVVHRAQHME